MKNLIFTIGTFCLALVTVVNAGNPDPRKEMATKYYNDIEATLMFPDDVLSVKTKTVIEQIAQDNEIINQINPDNELKAFKKTIEQQISEDNKIIDSNQFDYFLIDKLSE